MKIYITKYALTKGIMIHDAEICGDEKDMARVSKCDDFWIGATFFKNEWFDTNEKAIMNAYDRRDKKIKAIFKQIAKLEEMVF